MTPMVDPSALGVRPGRYEVGLDRRHGQPPGGTAVLEWDRFVAIRGGNGRKPAVSTAGWGDGGR